jgi:hypothetical protein
MASKHEATNFIKSTYRCEEISGGTLKFVFELDGGRSQLVFADVNDSNIQYLSPFASVNDVTAKQALEANADYSVGMQIVGDQYMIKHLAFLADLDESEIDGGFRLVANVADKLEQKLVGSDKH